MPETWEEIFLSYLMKANEAPLFRLREQDLQYKEKLKQFCALLEYLETFAPSSNVDVI